MKLSRRGKRRLTLVASLLVVLVVAAAAFKLIRGVQQDRLYAEARSAGLAAHEQGDLDTAIEKLSFYLQRDNRDAEVLVAFAEARAQVPLINDRHVYDAIGLYKRALEVLDDERGGSDHDQQTEHAVRELMQLYGRVGMWFEQIQMADRLLAQDPDDVDALSARTYARILRRESGSGDAEADAPIDDVRRLVELEPDAIEWRQLELRLMSGEGRSTNDLLERIDDWIETHEGDGRYHVLRAGVLASDRQLDEAVRAMDEAVARGASTLPVLQMTVQMLAELQPVNDEARDLAALAVEDARQRFPDQQWVRQMIVQRHWQAGELAKARTELEEARADFEMLEPPLLRLDALVRFMGGRRGEVSAVLDELRASARQQEPPDEPAIAWANALEARLRLDNDSWADAMRAIEHAISLQGDDPALRLLKGEVLSLINEKVQANAAYGEAYRLDPAWILAGVNYARSLLQIERPLIAFDVAYRTIRRSGLSMVDPYLVYAEAYVAALAAGADPPIQDSVAAWYEVLFAQMPNRPEFARLLAEIYVRTGRSAEARELMRDQLDPEATPNQDVLMALAEVSAEHGLELEQQLLDRARDVGGLTLPVAFQLAEQAALEGRAAEGLALIDRALDEAPPQTRQSRPARQARLRYLIGIEDPNVPGEIERFADDFAGDPVALGFVLKAAPAWNDPTLIDRVVTRLQTLTPGATQADLARARYLVRFESEKEASLAEAIRILNDVIATKSPGSVEARRLMALAAIKGNQIPRAIVNLKEAIDLDRNAVELYPTLVALLQQQGEVEEAATYLRRLSATNATRSASVIRDEIEVLQRQGDFDAAFARASALGEAADQMTLASLSRSAGRHDEAERIYATLLSKPDVDALAVQEAADFYAETGRFDRGLALLMEHRDHPKIDHALAVGRYHRRHGDLEEARSWLERAVGQGDPRARLELAQLHLDEGRPEQAGVLLQGLGDELEDEQLLGQLARAQLEQGGVASVDTALATLRRLGGDSPDLLAAVQFVQDVESGRLDPSDRATLEAARRLVQEHGSLPAVWSIASSVFARAGRGADAIALVRTAASRFPTDVSTPRRATELLTQARRWPEALAEAERWRQRSLDDPLDADLVIAELRLRLGQPVAAADQLTTHTARVLAQGDRHPERLAVWLQAQVGANRTERVGEAAALLLDDASWRDRWIELCLPLPDAAAARGLDLLDAATIEQPGERLQIASAWTMLAMRSGATAHFDAAQRWAESVLETDLQVQALLSLGVIAEGRGQPDLAEQRYRAVLAERPEDPVALNNLAFVLATAGRGDEAVSIARRALLLRPDLPGVKDTYAHALIADGRPSEAIEVLDEVLAERPDAAEILLTLVQALLDVGEYERADERLDAARLLLESSGRASRVQLQRAERLRQQLASKRSARVETEESAQAGGGDVR